MIVGLAVEGAAGVQAALAQLDAKVQTRAMRAGLRDAGEVVRDAETEAAPVRPELPSGTALPPGALKSDVTLTVMGIEGQLAAVVQPGKLTRHVASWVEYGHRLVRGGYNSSRYRRGKFIGYKGPGKEVGFVPAHPYIRPAFEASVTACVQAFIERLRREIAKRS